MASRILRLSVLFAVGLTLLTASVAQSQDLGTLAIVKLIDEDGDGASDVPGEGITFVVEDATGAEVGRGSTDAGGGINFNLPPGTYRVTDQGAPDLVHLDPASGVAQADIRVDETTTLLFLNQRVGGDPPPGAAIEVQKMVARDGQTEPSDGWEFVLSMGGTEIARGITGPHPQTGDPGWVVFGAQADGSPLPAGDYRVEEVPQAGFQVIDPVDGFFDIFFDGVANTPLLFINGPEGDGGGDPPSGAAIEVQKMVARDGQTEPSDGWEFVLSMGGTEIARGITGPHPHTGDPGWVVFGAQADGSPLPAGDYRVEEVPQAGFQVIDPVDGFFDIFFDGAANTPLLFINGPEGDGGGDPPPAAAIEVQKMVARDGQTEPSDGWEFVLSMGGTEIARGITGPHPHTGDSGWVVFGAQADGSPLPAGDYRVEEVPQAGFQVIDPVEGFFDIFFDGAANTTLLFINGPEGDGGGDPPAGAAIEVQKMVARDGQTEPSDGWEFVLSMGGTEIARGITGPHPQTGDPGWVVFGAQADGSPLPAGDYRVEEVPQPGFQVIDPVEGFFDIFFDGVANTPLLFVNGPEGDGGGDPPAGAAIEVQKMVARDGQTEPSDGWEFVLSMGGTEIARGITGPHPHTGDSGWVVFGAQADGSPLPAGDYRVEEVPQAGFQVIDPVEGFFDIFFDGAANTTLLFINGPEGDGGGDPPAGAAIEVQKMVARDGQTEPSDGWEFVLSMGGTEIARGITGPHPQTGDPGWVVFGAQADGSPLPAGDYRVEEVPQPGFQVIDPVEGFFDIFFDGVANTPLLFVNGPEGDGGGGDPPAGAAIEVQKMVARDGQTEPADGWEFVLSMGGTEIARGITGPHPQTGDPGWVVFGAQADGSPLAAGDYRVEEVPQAGFQVIDPVDGFFDIFFDGVANTPLFFVNGPEGDGGGGDPPAGAAIEVQKMVARDGQTEPADGWEFVLSMGGTEIARGITGPHPHTGDPGWVVFGAQADGSPLPAGDYRVEEVPQAGFQVIDPVDGFFDIVFDGAANTTLLFINGPEGDGGGDPPAGAAIEVQKMVARDGQTEPSDGWEFVLSMGGTEIARGITGPHPHTGDSGWVVFGAQADGSPLPAGDYRVEEVPQAGFQVIDPVDGFFDIFFDGVANTPLLFINAAEGDGGGDPPAGGIAGLKFEITDPTQPGTPANGWTIVLETPAGEELARTVTADDPGTGSPGWYRFETLADGSPIPQGRLIVREELIDGWEAYEPPDGRWEIDYDPSQSVHLDFVNGPPGGAGDDGPGIFGQKIDARRGEPIDGWRFVLVDADTGEEIASSVTGPEPDNGEPGWFWFEQRADGTAITAGRYLVREEMRDGWVALDPPGGELAIDYDPKQPLPPLLFVNQEEGGDMAGIHGRKIDGLSNEGLNGWTIVLEDDAGNEIARTVTATLDETGEEGVYWFENVPAGSYRIYEVQQDGWVAVHPPEGEYRFDYSEGETQFFDFVNITEDVNDGDIPGILGQKLDASTGQPIDGWKIYLVNGSGQRIDSTRTQPHPLTGEAGWFRLEPPAPGDYTIAEEEREGWTMVDPSDGAVRVRWDEGATIFVTFVNAPDDPGGDGGDDGDEPVSIHGLKFEDLNGNGIFDAGEFLLPGVMFEATTRGSDGTQFSYLAESMLDDPTTAEEETGHFWFLDLPPGTYRVHELVGAGFTQTTADPAPITLASGEHAVATDGDVEVLVGFGIDRAAIRVVPELAFGNQREASTPGEIHGFKFEDLDADGFYTPGVDQPSGGVSFTLESAAGADLGTVQTDATGRFAFLNLAPGTYVVRETDDSRQVTPSPPALAIKEGEIWVATDEQALEAVQGGASSDRIRFESLLAFGNGRPEVTGNPDSPTESGVTIIGLKFEDANGNGVRDEGEPGLPGIWFYYQPEPVDVLLSVETQADDPLTSDIDETGFFVIEGSDSFEYRIWEGEVEGMTQTTSDPPLLPGSPGGFWVATPEQRAWLESEGIASDRISEEPLLAFGNQFSGPGSVFGFKFADLNQNGLREDTEPFLEGWEIILEGTTSESQPVRMTTQTDDRGAFLFEDVPAGGYTVSETQQDGWQQSAPVTGAFTIDVGDGERVGPLGFGNWKPSGGLTVFKYEDLNGNGKRDRDEPGMNGVGISVVDGQGGVFDVETEPHPDTGEPGWARFDGLASGIALVSETLAACETAEWLVTFPTPDCTHSVDVGSSAAGGVQTFGNFRKGQIHGYKFNDLNANGVDDAEPRVEGLTVVLESDRDGDGTPETQETVTDANGEYWFEGLLPGVYRVFERAPAGTGLTTVPPEPITITSGAVFVAVAGMRTLHDTQREQVDVRLAFGNAESASIHGRKFADLDADGQMNGGDFGVDGVLIRLIVDGEVVDETVTHTDPATGEAGWYWFENLRPGTYTVAERIDDGYVPSAPAGGVHADISLVAGQVIERLDFGNVPLGSIHGMKWLDADGDGVRSGAEDGIPGWPIAVYRDSDGDGAIDASVDDLVADTETMPDDPGTRDVNEAGHYWVTGLPPGTYLVVEGDRDNWERTFPQDPGIHTVTLGAGETVENIDFGNRLTLAEIHGLKWRDIDSNRARGAGERGLPDWTIRLFVDDGDGALGGTDTQVGSQTTGPNGRFRFVDLQPGTYHVAEVIPPGWVQTYPNDSSDPSSTPYHTVTMASGAVVQNVNFGNRLQGATITGRKFRDADGDGRMGDSEERLSGWRIYLDTNNNAALDQGEKVASTGDDGVYAFADLVPGDYIVREVGRTGWRQTFPTSLGAASSHTVTVGPGETVEDVNFGNRQARGGLAGVKWLDLNGDGLRDAGEPGLADWVIYLDLDGDGRKDEQEPSRRTDADGVYSFSNLLPATYTVREVLTNGWTQTWPSGGEYSVEVLASSVAENVDFGNRLLRGEIQGRKWYDRDGDGDVAAGDTPISGWTIYLYVDTDGSGDLDITQDGRVPASTDSDGVFWFTDLAPGLYFVVEGTKVGWRQTMPVDAGGQPTHYRVVLQAGDSVRDRDFANTLEQAEIHGTVFNDRDGDATRDTNEGDIIEVSGGVTATDRDVTVWLDLDGDFVLDPGEPVTTETTDNGDFWFTGLAAGTYNVVATVRNTDQARDWQLTGIEGSPAVAPAAATITVAAGDRVEDVDFGFRDSGQVSATDESGLQGANQECELQGVDVCEVVVGDDAGKRAMKLSAEGDTLRLTAPLPAFTVPVVFDGGGRVLDGSALPAGTAGLQLAGGASVVRNVTLTGFSGAGIVLVGNDNTVESATITANGGAGISVVSGRRNLLRNNAIFANGGVAIDLGGDGRTANDAFDADSGPNGRQNYPELEAASLGSRTITGSLESLAAGVYTLDFYASATCADAGEGQTLLSSAVVITDAAGTADFSAVIPDGVEAGTAISAVATDVNGNTSEFAPCVSVEAPFLARIDLSPPSAAVVSGGELQFFADGFDQFDYGFVFAPEWTSSEGDIDQTGFLRVGDQPAGTLVVSAADDATGLDATATVTITSGVSTEPDAGAEEIPQTYQLLQNYPNPFNPITTIEFALPVHQHVVLEVYDVLGRRVRVLVDGDMGTGRHQVQFDARSLASGMYFYRLTAGPFQEVKSFTLVK